MDGPKTSRNIATCGSYIFLNAESWVLPVSGHSKHLRLQLRDQ